MSLLISMINLKDKNKKESDYIFKHESMYLKAISQRCIEYHVSNKLN